MINILSQDLLRFKILVSAEPFVWWQKQKNIALKQTYNEKLRNAVKIIFMNQF